MKILRLHKISKSPALHLVEISKHLKELTEIYVCGIIVEMTEAILVELIKNAEKLKELIYCSKNRISKSTKVIIDGYTFKKLVQIVEQRPAKTKLNLYLAQKSFEITVPEEYAELYRNMLTVRYTHGRNEMKRL